MLNMNAGFIKTDKTQEVQDILIQGGAGETSFSRRKEYYGQRPLYIADSSTPLDPHRIDRICETIRSLLVLATNKHLALNNPTLLTRLVTDEFSFYTKDRPLSLDEYCSIIQKIKEMFRNPIIPPNTYVPPNIHLMLATFPVLGDDKKIHNSALYVQSPHSGNPPLIHHFEKENASVIDFQYGYIDNAGNKYIYPLIGDNPFNDVFLTAQNSSMRKLASAGVTVNDPNQYQSALKLTTSTGASFLTTTGICLDHEMGVCKKNLNQLIHQLSASGQDIPLKVSHIISSFSIAERPKNIAATIVHADPHMGQNFMGVGSGKKLPPLEQGQLQATFGSSQKYFQRYSPKAIGLAKEEELDNIISKMPAQVSLNRLNLQDANGNTILHRSLLEPMHEYNNALQRLAMYGKYGARIDIKNTNGYSVLDLVLSHIKDASLIPLIYPILQHPDLQKANFFASGETMVQYVYKFWQGNPSVANMIATRITEQASSQLTSAILNTLNPKIPKQIAQNNLHNALNLVNNISGLQFNDVMLALNHNCFAAVATMVARDPGLLNKSLNSGSETLSHLLMEKLSSAIEANDYQNTLLLAQILQSYDLLKTPNSSGENFLHYAALNKSHFALEALIEVNPMLLHAQDNQHRTPLQLGGADVLFQVLNREINYDNYARIKMFAEISKNCNLLHRPSVEGNLLHTALFYNKGNAARALTEVDPTLLSQANSRQEFPLDLAERIQVSCMSPQGTSIFYSQFVANTYQQYLGYKTPPLNLPAAHPLPKPMVNRYSSSPNIPFAKPALSDLEVGIMKILNNPQATFSIGSTNTATILYFNGKNAKGDAENFTKSAFASLGINSAQASKQGINKPKGVQFDNTTQQYCVYLTPADVNKLKNFSHPSHKRKF